MKVVSKARDCVPQISTRVRTFGSRAEKDKPLVEGARKWRDARGEVEEE